MKLGDAEAPIMYAVVGCNECGTLWLLEDPDAADSATCPRCGKSHRTGKLKRFFESAERAPARQARSALLAKKRDESEAFAELDHVSEMEAQVEEAGVDDREYLEGSGLDADEVFAAGDAGSGGGSRSREEVLRDAVREADEPTEAGIVAYAESHGVPPEAARDLLSKLVRRGEATESAGEFRLL